MMKTNNKTAKHLLLDSGKASTNNECFDRANDVIKIKTDVVTDTQGNIIIIETPRPEYLYTL